MSRRNEDIFRFEKKATNHIGLFVVIFLAIILLGGGGLLIYIYRDKIDWELSLPWEGALGGSNDKEKSKNKNSKKELIIPTINRATIAEGKTTFEITKIEADDKGYLITAMYLTYSRTSKMIVDTLIIDGFYTTTEFEVKDEYNWNDKSTHEGQEIKFRINKTELDNYNLSGFSSLTFHYTIIEPEETFDNQITRIAFTNSISLDNGFKGLLKVDQVEDITIEYYKAEEYPDGTYIYFLATNADARDTRELKIKKLIINDRIYDMPEFSETLYKGCKRLFHIKIPSNKIREVEEFTVSFYVLKDDDTTGKYTTVSITNDYTNDV